MLGARQKYIFCEAEEHRTIVESLIDKTLNLKSKLYPQDQLRPTLMQFIEPNPDSNSRRKSILLKVSKKDISPSPKLSPISSDNEDMDTSVESAQETTKVNLSRFIDKKEEVEFYKHEKSFRRKTNHLIATALDKERVGKDKVDIIIPQMGNFMSKAANKYDMISRIRVGGDFPDLTSKMAKETSQTCDRTQRKSVVISTPY